ncbi:MAG TPA: VOC family protein [Gemmatimonadaceae bacterium]|nr:VOC family protein [Gemmatimonadaceae bacterium]
MPKNSSHGRFVWYELMTLDPDAAGEFYRGVTGWATMPFEGAGVPYTFWMNGEAPIGGLMTLPQELASMGVPPHWLPYVGVDDCDATAEKAKKLGARVNVPPTDIPNVGRFAVLADPQGAVFAIVKELTPPERDDSLPERGQVSWHELMTTDHTAAFDFYSKLFGWQKTTAMDMGEMGTYQMYGTGKLELGGMFNLPPGMPAPPNWLIYVKVPDADKAAARVKESGGQVMNGPMDIPGGGRIAQCLDPQGAAFAVHSAPAS